MVIYEHYLVVVKKVQYAHEIHTRLVLFVQAHVLIRLNYLVIR